MLGLESVLASSAPWLECLNLRQSMDLKRDVAFFIFRSFSDAGSFMDRTENRCCHASESDSLPVAIQSRLVMYESKNPCKDFKKTLYVLTIQ
jgi:hypothetical protein